jgi:biotin transport system substrate-specific component
MIAAEQLRMTVYASLLAALTAAGAYLAIPIGPVPIVLQNFFVFLSGLLLGSRWGFASVSVYILVGACGLPIFSIGRGGIGHIMGPTGGYLIGFLPAVYIIGLISEKGGQRVIFDIIAMVCGALLVYAFGVPWLYKVLAGKGMTLQKAFFVGMYPFVPGDILKIAVAVPVAKALRPVIRVPGSGFRVTS